MSPAACCSRARRRRTTSWSMRSPRGCTSCLATASAWPSCPSTRAGRSGSTTRTSTSPSTSATPLCPAPAARSSSSAWPAASSPRRSTAPARCGRSGWSRAFPRVASRCCPRPTTRWWTGSRASTSPPSSSTPPRTRCRWRAPDHEWVARPLPTGAQLLADALLERATVPAEIVRGVRATLRGPRHVAARVGRALGGVGAMARAGLQAAPPGPLNVRIGPHRRFTWVRADLGGVQGDQERAGGDGQRRRARHGRRRAGPLPADARREHR